MKTFKTIMALAALCAGLVSCSKDVDSSARGERLLEGRYPIEFTAAGVDIEPLTRATVDGDWSGEDSVAVWVYTRSSNVKRYSVTSGDTGKTAKFTSDDPFWWEFSGEEEGVLAWYPYSDTYPADWTVKADQSVVENYRASDLVIGKNPDLRFAERNDPSKNKITFMHSTSKIVVNLVAGPGITLDGNTSVQLLNVSGVETGNTVTAYRPDAAKQNFHALLSPQKIAAGTPFIQVKAGSGTFVYTPSAERQLNSHTSYTYTITVKANGIEVTEAMGGEWTDGGSEDVSSMDVIIYTASDLKLGDYYYSDGTWSDGGLRKLYSDGTTKCAETVTQPISGKTCIGIVFHVGQHETDQSNYLQPLTGDGPTIPDGKVHGYVVALMDVNDGGSDRLRWEYGPGNVYNQAIDASTSTRDWQGYSNSLKFHEFVNKNENKEAGWEMKHFPAALACETYGNRKLDKDGNDANGKYDWQKPLAAPGNTSGWFLPSYGQLQYLYQNRSVLSARMTDVKNNTPTDCSYKDKINWFSTSLYYWSSTEGSDDPGRAWNVSFNYGDGYSSLKYGTYVVRAVLAF